MVRRPALPLAASGSRDPGAPPVLGFVLTAWALTWCLAVPTALAWTRGQAPGAGAIAAAGLSAFGPLVAALVFGARQRDLRGVFGRWRANPGWVVLALLTPALVHVAAIALYALLGGQPAAWLHPPAGPEQLAALVVFPLGEEFGWRGFAHPRLVARHGLVRGSLLLGLAWGLWHLAYGVTPAAAGFDVGLFAITMTELPLYSLLIAWVFERTGRSMAVAIAFHAGAHLDHLEAARDVTPGLHAAHLAVVATLALLAARSLARSDRAARSA